MGAGGDGPRYLFQVQLHGGGIAEGQNEARSLTLFRANRAEDVGRFRALVTRRAGTRSPRRPSAGDLVLLTHPRLILT